MNRPECLELDCCPPVDYNSNGLIQLWNVSDLGVPSANTESVADFLDGKDATAIIMSGDLDYQNPHDYDTSVDQYYSFWKERELLFPVPGNHDWDFDNLLAYLEYFDYLVGRRYYSKRIGPLGLFFIDSGINTAGTVVEPDGNSIGSVQNERFVTIASQSSAPWKIAILHHSPYSSDSTHGSNTTMQWDFEDMGIDVVLSGHAHTYEHLLIDNVHYFVNGLGGASIYNFGTPVDGSITRFNSNHGALSLRAGQNELEVAFYTRNGVLVDLVKLQK